MPADDWLSTWNLHDQRGLEPVHRGSIPRLIGMPWFASQAAARSLTGRRRKLGFSTAGG